MHECGNTNGWLSVQCLLYNVLQPLVTVTKDQCMQEAEIKWEEYLYHGSWKKKNQMVWLDNSRFWSIATGEWEHRSVFSEDDKYSADIERGVNAGKCWMKHWQKIRLEIHKVVLIPSLLYSGDIHTYLVCRKENVRQVCRRSWYLVLNYLCLLSRDSAWRKIDRWSNINFENAGASKINMHLLILMVLNLKIMTI